MRIPLFVAMAMGLGSAAVMAENPDYSLTIYSSAQPGQISTERLANYGGSLPGYALVRDGRKMSLAAGNGVLRFTDVAKRIDPTTVAFESLTDPAGTRVVEQNYQYDLVSSENCWNAMSARRLPSNNRKAMKSNASAAPCSRRKAAP